MIPDMRLAEEVFTNETFLNYFNILYPIGLGLWFTIAGNAHFSRYKDKGLIYVHMHNYTTSTVLVMFTDE